MNTIIYSLILIYSLKPFSVWINELLLLFIIQRDLTPTQFHIELASWLGYQ